MLVVSYTKRKQHMVKTRQKRNKSGKKGAYGDWKKKKLGKKDGEKTEKKVARKEQQNTAETTRDKERKKICPCRKSTTFWLQPKKKQCLKELNERMIEALLVSKVQ